MNTKFKLSLLFATGGLVIALLVEYGFAHVISNGEYHRDATLLNQYAKKFSSDLPAYYTRPESLTQLQAAVANFGVADISAILLDKSSRVIAAGPPSLSLERAAALVQQFGIKALGHPDGYADINDLPYVWSTTPVAGTSYSLTLIYAAKRSQPELLEWPANAMLLLILGLVAAVCGAFGFHFGALVDKTHALNLALQTQSLHDTLTGLPNRSLFIDRVRQQIQHGRRNGQNLAVCHVNLERFCNINELLGAANGDQMLRLVGQRLKKTVRESDTIARASADQFLILLNDVDESQVLQVAQKVMGCLQEHFDIGEHNLFVRGNVGIALYPQHGEDEQALMQHAEIALRVAKKANTDVIVYNKKHDEYSIKHLALVSDIHNAISQDQFELFFQPKVRIADGTISSAEVLLRWNHPHQGQIPPGQFIPVAEQTGLIQPLTQWVVNNALNYCAQLQQLGFDLTLSVNISMYNLIETDFDRKVRELLALWSIPPQRLELEITESAMMSNPARSKELLTQLDAFGLRLSIDDFGTGYSSLTYLKQLPVDELKIDKSFVLQMHRDDNDAAIVRTIVGLAHDLGLQVVAEGVELEVQLEQLRKFGCDGAQGNYLCPPLPFKDFVVWLENSQTRIPASLVS